MKRCLWSIALFCVALALSSHAHSQAQIYGPSKSVYGANLTCNTVSNCAYQPITYLPFPLWVVGTGASSSGCSATSVKIGASSWAFIGGGILTSGTSGTCTLTFTLPAAANGWICAGTDITLRLAFTQTTPLSTTGCTITSPTTSGDQITVSFLGG